MEIVPLCPFEVGAFVWEAQPGQSSLTIVVKATFTLASGELRVAPAQDPLGEERHLEDSALASLHAPGDFAPSKRKVDVSLVGHAYAPRGRPVESLEARLVVGNLDKTVRVTGDRVWTRDASLQPVASAPAPFARMPLRYERAALSTDNPVGLDRGAQPRVGAPALPNLERAGGAGVPCFGPVSPQWRARRRLIDEGSMFWAYGVARAPREGAPPVGPAPPRFDFAFFNAAPPDQQIDMLRAGAPILLEHLHPEHPRLEARVPALRPQVFHVPPAGGGPGRVEEVILRCDGLWIDTDRAVLVLTWRGLTEAPGGAAEVGTLVMDADPGGKKLRWDRVEKRLAEVRPPTLRLPDGRPAPSPFRRTVPTGPDPLAVRYDGRGRPPDGTSEPTEALGPPMSLAPESVPDEPTNPVEPPTLQRHAAASAPLPPRRKAGTITAVRPSVKVPGPTKPGAATGPASRAPAAPVAPPRMASPPVVQEAPAASRAPAPPGVLGGAPRPAATRAPSPDTTGRIAPPKPVVPTVPIPPPVASAASPGAVGPALRKDLDIARYGTIAAELAHKGESRAAVLKAHLLTEPAWALVDQHWKKAITQETEEGGRTLLLAFDEAYLAAQQRLGKAVGVAEYARIQVGLERGEVGRVLADLALELGDLMRLQRVWTKRLADSPDLAAALGKAVDDARRAMP